MKHQIKQRGGHLIRNMKMLWILAPPPCIYGHLGHLGVFHHKICWFFGIRLGVLSLNWSDFNTWGKHSQKLWIGVEPTWLPIRKMSTPFPQMASLTMAVNNKNYHDHRHDLSVRMMSWRGDPCECCKVLSRDCRALVARAESCNHWCYKIFACSFLFIFVTITMWYRGLQGKLRVLKYNEQSTTAKSNSK